MYKVSLQQADGVQQWEAEGLACFCFVSALFSAVASLRQCCLDLSRGEDKSVSLTDLEFLQLPPSAGLITGGWGLEGTSEDL